jgi:hypothetical protein
MAKGQTGRTALTMGGMRTKDSYISIAMRWHSGENKSSIGRSLGLSPTRSAKIINRGIIYLASELSLKISPESFDVIVYHEIKSLIKKRMPLDESLFSLVSMKKRNRDFLSAQDKIENACFEQSILDAGKMIVNISGNYKGSTYSGQHIEERKLRGLHITFHRATSSEDLI